MSKYRYYVSGTEVFPLNKDDITFQYEKKIQSALVLEKTLQTELIFNYQSGAFNFKTQETNSKCAELDFLITRNCNGTTADFFKGVFSVIEGSFDDDICRFTIKARLKSELIDDVEYDILNCADIVQVNASLYLGSRTYVNGRKFGSTLLYIAQQANPKIVGIISDFFQINPTGPFPLTGPTNIYQYLVFCSLSDIQEPIPSNLSTRCVVTFKDLMNDLNTLFDVFWYIDSSLNLRIEHRTFFDGIAGLNLTLPQYSKWLVGKNKYEYDDAEYPREETWNIQGHNQSVKLTYGGIAAIKKNTNSKSYQTSKINTDLNARVTTGGDDPGIFLFACDNTYTCLNTAIGSNDNILTPYQLVKDLHVFNRPSLYSLIRVMNNNVLWDKSGGLLMQSVSPQKKQVEITFPLCCDETFDFKNTMTTALGDGYTEKATLNIKDDLFKTQLLYKIDNCADFQPSDLTGLDLWLKYNEGITKSGTLVSQWNDASGNARHAVQGTGANKPSQSGGVGSGSAIVFAVGQFLTTPAFQLFPSKRGTVIILCNTGLGPMGVLSTNDGTASNFFDLSYDGASKYKSYNEGLFYPFNIDITFWLQQKGLFVINRNADTKIYTTQNDVPCNKNPSNANPMVIANNQPASKPMIIGDNASLNSTFAITPGGSTAIYEIIIYNRSLSDLELQQISFYLVKKQFPGFTPATSIYNIYP